ncbi:hypothetical protein CRG98_030160 [Punica granatum]|uniref:Reverse transcriptase domain-containing protein n=1 Tax=Punica granatum TaxID=22663 RepID=A0A2I0IZJ7_PUNGR|nr:hypothetical protein CRG98_030160 [Punica granatum]
MAEGQDFDKYATEWRAQAAKHVLPISKKQQIQLFHSTLKGVYYSYLLAHTSSFSNLIDAGKKLDMGIKLGKIEGPTIKKEGEFARKSTAGTTGISAVFHEFHAGTTSYSSLYSTACPLPAAGFYSPTGSAAVVRNTADCPLYSRTSSGSAKQSLGSETSSIGTISSSRAIRSYRRHLVLTLTQQIRIHICVASIIWRLREKIQEMIDTEKLSFNAVKPPNVQANPLPDHGSRSRPTINMISICALGGEENKKEDPIPFVIEYVPKETTVGFMGSSVLPAPFVIDVPAKEPYQDNRVPWTYESCVGNLEQQMSVMGVTCSGRVYENSEAALETAQQAAPIPAKAFMKIIKMNVDFNRIRPSKTAVRAFDGSRRDVNGEINLLIDIGPCSFVVIFQVLDIPNTFNLLLGRPWIHLAGAVPSSLHQTLKFIVEEKLMTVKGEEDYAIYKETVVPHINIRDDQNHPFYSFETISFIKDYGEVGPSRAIAWRGLGFHHSYHEIDQARKGKHLHCLSTYHKRINRGISVRPLSHFFPGPPCIVEGTLEDPYSDLDGASVCAPAIYAITEETPPGSHIRPARENEELSNWTLVLHYLELLEKPQPIYFGEGLDENDRVPEIEESLQCLKDHQLTSVEPTEEINISIEAEPRTLKIRTGLDSMQRAWMIDFMKEYQEHLHRQQADLHLRIKEEVVKQINASFLKVCNYSEWVVNIVLVEKKDGRVRVCVDYRDHNKFSRYNQIRMAEEDKIKTTFITMWGTFCYKVMPFGLKNVGAMVTLFHDMMHKEIEVYVDDMIAKSKEGEDHLVNLKRFFDRLKKYKL